MVESFLRFLASSVDHLHLTAIIVKRQALDQGEAGAIV